MSAGSTRHKWGEPNRLYYDNGLPSKTERECARCALLKVTRHELGVRSWVEWHKGGARVHSELTPRCDASAEVPA